MCVCAEHRQQYRVVIKKKWFSCHVRVDSLLWLLNVIRKRRSDCKPTSDSLFTIIVNEHLFHGRSGEKQVLAGSWVIVLVRWFPWYSVTLSTNVISIHSLSDRLYGCMFKVTNFSFGDMTFNVIALFPSRITVVCEVGVQKSWSSYNSTLKVGWSYETFFF